MKRGVWQLQRLELVYCQFGGSSRGVRALLDETLDAPEPRAFRAWKGLHQRIEVELVARNGHHPLVRAHYREGRQLRDGRREPKQICVKNAGAGDVLAVVKRLQREGGGKAKSWNLRQWRPDTQSVQGVWTPLTRIQ